MQYLINRKIKNIFNFSQYLGEKFGIEFSVPGNFIISQGEGFLLVSEKNVDVVELQKAIDDYQDVEVEDAP